MKPTLFTSIVLFTLSVQWVSSLNILGIFPYNGRSHFTVFRPYLFELANRGHNVTVISPFPQKDPPKNYHDISLANRIKPFVEELTIERPIMTLINLTLIVLDNGNKHCAAMLENKQVKDLVKNKVKFDVVVFEQFNTDCALGIAYKLEAPVVAVTSAELMPWMFERLGLSYSPHIFLNGGNKPNLLQRAAKTILHFVFRFYYKYVMQSKDQEILAQHYDDIPPLEELASDIKFLLAYNNFILTGSRVFPSNVIEVGGYHIPKAKPLTGNLKKFIEESEHGVIFISFGSNVKTSSMPADKLQVILDAMKEFPQRFIWKWEDDALQGHKEKLYTDVWLPQVDILAHPKTLAFYTHAGMGGTMEGTYFGIPMLAMPITAEQPYNAANIEQSGLGVQLQYSDLTKDNLVAALKQILEPEFRERVKERSKAWHDRPHTAMDAAIFWTEFAARHPTLSFRSAVADVPLYQYLFLDTFLVLIVLILTPIAVSYSILKICFKAFSKLRKSPAKKQKPKRE